MRLQQQPIGSPTSSSCSSRLISSSTAPTAPTSSSAYATFASFPQSTSSTPKRARDLSKKSTYYSRLPTTKAAHGLASYRLRRKSQGGLTRTVTRPSHTVAPRRASGSRISRRPAQAVITTVLNGSIRLGEFRPRRNHLPKRYNHGRIGVLHPRRLSGGRIRRLGVRRERGVRVAPGHEGRGSHTGRYGCDLPYPSHGIHEFGLPLRSTLSLCLPLLAIEGWTCRAKLVQICDRSFCKASR